MQEFIVVAHVNIHPDNCEWNPFILHVASWHVDYNNKRDDGKWD